MKSRRGAVASMPQAEKRPGKRGTAISFTPSSRPRLAPCMAPPPPPTISAKSRGSWPRWIDTSLRALIMLALTSRITATAASSTLQPSPSATLPMAVRARSMSSEEPPAREVRRIQHAGDELGVGHGGLAAAASIARRAGIGAGAAGAHAERAALVEPGDGTAARADLHDVDHGDPHRIAVADARRFEPVVGGDLGFAVLDGGALGCRAADVEINHVGLVAEAPDQGSAVDARRRARFQQRDRMLPGPAEARGAAVRLHRHHRAVEGEGVEAGLQRVEVSLHDGLHVGVEHGRVRTLVLAPLARDLVGGGDRHAIEALPQIGRRLLPRARARRRSGGTGWRWPPPPRLCIPRSRGPGLRDAAARGPDPWRRPVRAPRSAAGAARREPPCGSADCRDRGDCRARSPAHPESPRW